MQEKYTGNAVIERGYAIYDEWNKNKYKSRKIVNSVQMAVASTNAKNTLSSHAEALAYLFALDLRIKERYNSLIKCIFLYFSWRRETGAFKRLKGMLRMPEGCDIRNFIEIELERLRKKMDADEVAGSDRNVRGGKVNEFSGEDAKVAEGEQQFETIEDETPEESLENEKNEEKSEEKEEKSQEIGEEKPIEEQNSEKDQEAAEEQKQEQRQEQRQEFREAESKSQEKSEGSASEEKIDQEKLFEQKTESNGFEKKTEPITNKKNENISYNGAIDIAPVFEGARRDDATKEISFIDEVIMDNMVKGESDIVGHNPLEDVKREGAEHFQAPVGQGVETVKDGKEDYLFDKMVLDGKENIVNNSPNAPQDEQKPQNVRNVPQDKEQAVLNAKPNDDVRVQIKIEENVSEENQFRRDINDQFTDKMVLLHKSLMEDALREEFKIDEREFGNDRPVIFEENNIEDAVDEITSVRKH